MRKESKKLIKLVQSFNFKLKVTKLLLFKKVVMKPSGQLSGRVVQHQKESRVSIAITVGHIKHLNIRSRDKDNTLKNLASKIKALKRSRE